MSARVSLFKLGAGVLVGTVAGVNLERYRNSLRLGSTVEAAAPLPAPIGGHEPSLTYHTKSNRVGEIMRHGYPSLDTIRMYDNYVLSYDRRNRTANWVFEHLSPELLKDPQDFKVDRSKCDFMEDNSVHQYFRATNADYKSSGFDRGHLAAAGNHRTSQEHVEQTFFLSNISPQVGRGFNRDAWNTLEKYVRYRAKGSKNLWVCTGPLYLPQQMNGKLYVNYQVIGQNQVAVPTHFFKAMLIEERDGSLHLESYLMQNKEIDSNLPLLAFQVPINVIERAAGLLLFHQIDKRSLKSINGRNKYLDKFTESDAKMRQKNQKSLKSG